MGRPREHNEATRQKLLVAAERLVGEGGAEAVTVRTAAERAGTTTRAVYALFGSKAGLLQALTQRTFELLRDQVGEVPLTEDPCADLVNGAARGFRPFALEHRDLFRLVFGLWLPAAAWSSEARAVQASTYNHLIRLVKRVDEAGLLGGRPVMDVVVLWDAICTGLAMREVCGMLDPAAAERLWTDGLRALLAGLESSPIPAGGSPSRRAEATP
jgi:AcrR family transcriptional regulator